MVFILFVLFACIFYFVYQLLSIKDNKEQVFLPDDIKGVQAKKEFDARNILDMTARFTDKIMYKKNNTSLLGKLKKKLLNAGSPMNVSQFLAFKFIMMLGLPGVILIFMNPIQPAFLGIGFGIGYIFPDMWITKLTKKRKMVVLRDLPYVIDLLNICVGAGLDFMVAVNHVTHEFKKGVLTDELKIMVKEIQMGLSRKEALKNLAYRINSPEINSFVRTLIQADRMGTPITAALKMHAEELRSIRFQKGEEMALKAPIKMLFPLMVFIMPVVLIIVAGPIMIQFMKGGMNF